MAELDTVPQAFESQAPPDKLQDFYNALRTNQNIKGLPEDYNSFKKAMNDPNKARAFYSAISQNENVKGIPESYDTFASGLGLKKKVSTSVSLNTLPSFQSGLSNFQGSPQSIENSPVTQAGMAEVLQQQNHARQQQQAKFREIQDAANPELRNAIANAPIPEQSTISASKKPSAIDRAKFGLKYITGNALKGVASSTVAPLYYYANKVGLASDEETKRVLDQVNTSDKETFGIKPENLNNAGGVLGAAGGLAKMLPALITAEGTGGASFALQNVGDAALQVQQMKNSGVKFENHSDDIYINAMGLVGLALGRGTFGKVFSKMPSSLRNAVTRGVVADGMEALGKKGADATAEDIAQTFMTKAAAVPQRVLTHGIDALQTYAKVGTEMSAANIASFGIKNVANSVNGSGEKPFKDVTVADLVHGATEPFYSNNFDDKGNPLMALANIATSTAGQFGVLHGITNAGMLFKGSRYENPIINQLRENNSPENVDKIKSDLTAIGKEKGLSDEEIDNTHKAVDVLAQTVGKLPRHLPKEKLQEGVSLIMGKNELEQELKSMADERGSLDPSISDIPSNAETILSDKIDQANDKLRSLVTGDRITYSKGTGEDEGTFYKTLGGKKEEISESRYNLERLERDNKNTPDEQTQPNTEIPSEQPTDETVGVPKVAGQVDEASRDNEVKPQPPIDIVDEQGPRDTQTENTVQEQPNEQKPAGDSGEKAIETPVGEAIPSITNIRAEAPETIAENKSPANPKQEAISPSQGDAGVSTKVKPVEHVKTFKLEVNEDLAKNDISLRGVQMSDGKFGIFQERNGRVMGKTLGRTFDTPEALQEAYDGGIKDKLTSDAINKATKEADISRQDESKPVDNKDKAKIFADKIRSLKVNKTAADIKKSNMHGGLAGVGVAVYDGALEIAAGIVEAGGSMADAIQAAVRHIKDNSDNKNDKEIYYSVRKELQSTGLLEASDIDYTKELKDAKQSQLSVINKGKSDDMLKMLGDIDPRHLNAEEIVKYNDIVNNKETSRDDIAKFIDDVHSRQDEEAQQREVDWYKQLKEEDATPETQEALAEAAKAKNDIKDKPTDDKAKKVLKKLLQVSRKDLRNADISKEFDAVKSAIIALDESKLTTRQLRDLNRDIEAMIYDGNYNGSGKWIALNEAIDKSATILDKLKKLAFKTNTTSVFASGFRSLDQNLETILRSSKAASILQEKSGIHDISAGNARVNKAMNSAIERFTKLIDKMPSDIQSVENRYKRGVLSLFTQNNNGISSAEHFELYKDRVSKSADALLKSDNKAENREGELVKSIYDKFVKDAQSSDEVVKAMTKDNANNAKLISHFIGEYSKIYPELRKITMLYSGRELPSIENYTATSFKKLHNADQTIAPAFEITDPLSSDKEDFSTDKGQSRTTLKRVGGMPKNKVMDLDFDGLQLNRLRESHYDVQTLASRYLFDAIRKQPDFNEAVGDNVGNVNAISEGVANMVKSQRGFNVTDPLAKIVLSATGRLRKAGVLIALKGVDQFVKQYPSVAVNTLMNLGADADLYAKALLVDIHNPIFNESGIGLRGLQAGGTSFENQLRTARISDFKRFSDSRAWINNKLHGVNTLLSKPLSMSDDAVARHSWLAYYMQDLRKQGTDVSAIDWSREHENINKEAAAYAEQMVSRNQIPNDPSKNAAFTQRGDVKDGKDLAFEVMKDVVIPFTSFARNTSVGIANNIRKFYGGDKVEAAKGLAATVAEAAVFNTIKAALGVFLYQNAQNMILQQFGYLKPKDKNIDIKGIATNTADDLLFAGMGSIVDNGIKSTINAAYATAKDDPRAQIFKVFDPSKFGETNWNSLGVYGVLPEKIQNMAQAIDYSDGGISERDRGGRKYTTHLSDKQAHLAQIVVALDLLSTIGLIGASTSRLSSQVFREIKKLKAPVKYSSGKYHNKQSGSE